MSKHDKKDSKKIKSVSQGVLSRGFDLGMMGLTLGARALGDTLSGKSVTSPDTILKQVRTLTKELGRLKGSVMKVGQMLSVYGEHFLTPEANLILKQLHSDSPPVEWKAMEQALVRQLGKEKVAELSIESEAHAAASLGQVHKAVVKKTKQTIALKIQYPGVDKAIDSDIKTLRFILNMAELSSKVPDLDNVFKEIRAMLRREVDYEKELATLQYFQKEFANDPRYIFPAALPEYSGKRVLAMDFVDGHKVDSKEVQSLSQEQRNRLAEAALDYYFKELFLLHSVQTDPHFGNYRVNIKKQAWVLYDFGAVREVSAEFMKHYAAMLKNVLAKDWEPFEQAAYGLGVLKKDDPDGLKALFRRFCLLIVEPFQSDAPFDWHNSDLPKRAVGMILEIKNGFPLRSPPQEIIFLDRKLVGMFTLMSALGAKFNARTVLYKYLK